MALGGGTFLTQNKTLPGSYINFVSAASATATISDRGVVAVPVSLDWGNDTDIFEVSSADMVKDSLKLFGYDYTHDKLKDLREVFRNAKKAFIYRLNGNAKATITAGNLTATAKWSGTRGNDLKVVITANIDDPLKFDIVSYLGTEKVDTQTALSNVEDLTNNDYIVFTGTGALALNAGAVLVGGSNAVVTGTQHQAFLSASESVGFNVMICPTDDAPTITLYTAHTKTKRDDQGVKFQTVVYRTAADHEGIISVENTIADAGANAYSLVYWVGGAMAGVQVNKSNTNKTYDGEYTVNVAYTQSQLETNLKSGKLMLHRVGDSIRVLDDINTLTTFTVDKSADFSSNQVIRVLDQIGNDIALLFNEKYLGKVQNNANGRVAFWNELVTYNKELETLGAIENFKPDDVIVEEGTTKDSVVVTNPVEPVTAMSKLYMTVIVS